MLNRTFILVDVENVSSLPIDFLDLSFEDSVKASMEEALTDDDLSVFDKYEMEYSLVHKPVCSWDAKDKNVEIAPGRETAVTVACYGKTGWYVFLMRKSGVLLIFFQHQCDHRIHLFSHTSKPKSFRYSRGSVSYATALLPHFCDCIPYA